MHAHTHRVQQEAADWAAVMNYSHQQQAAQPEVIT